jgi:hypothetical protein
MPEVLYDIRFAPIDMTQIVMIVLVFFAFSGVLGFSYVSRGTRKLLRTAFYSIFALAVTAILVGVLWSGFDRRTQCIAALESGRTQVLEGTLESFKRELIPGKTTEKEVRFTVQGKEFVEENVATRTCGIVKRYSDISSPKIGTALRITYFGDSVLQVIKLAR